MIKILIAESIDLPTLEVFKSQNKDLNFDYRPDIASGEIESVLNDYECLIVRPKEVSATAINSAPNLKLIVRGGAGLNSIDLEAAKKRGVEVQNTPGQNSTSTAEFAFNMIFELVAKRQMRRAANDVLSGDYMEPEAYSGFELSGRKIAIVGMGNIGNRLAKMAAGFDMEIIYHSRTKKDVPYKYFDSLSGLLQEGADIISLHCPLDGKTDKMFGNEEFSMMKKGTVLINCARPQLVCHNAFEHALRDGTLSSAGIDGDYELIEPFIVCDTENKCIFTHHIADSTLQAQEKITHQVLKQVREFFNR